MFEEKVEKVNKAAMADLQKKIDDELEGCKRNENEHLIHSIVQLSKIKLYLMITFLLA